MDVNGTRFHLLLGPADWAGGSNDGRVAYDGERDELTLLQRQFTFPSPLRETVLGQSARRGAARDRYGSWYWIDRDPTRVLVTSSGSGQTTQYWPAQAMPSPAARAAAGGFAALASPAPADPPLAGAAVTSDEYLVVGCLAEPGLLVFDLLAGGPPDRLRWDIDTFTPHDIAPRPGGGVVILDRAARRYWELDRSLRIVTRAPPPGQDAAFGPASPDPEDTAGHRLPAPTAADAVPLDAGPAGAGADPIAVGTCGDGTVLVLFRHPDGTSVRPYRDGLPAAPAVPLPAPDGDQAPPRLLGHDMAVLAPRKAPAGELARLFVSEAHGDQCYEFALTLAAGVLTVTPRLRYLPMRLHGGQAIVAAAGQVWYDSSDRWLPLAEQPRCRYETLGTLTTDLFDGGKPECAWHRLMIDAKLPAGTSIVVDSAAAEDAARLQAAPAWQREPEPYPRGPGPELPFAAAGGYRTLELAFQRARGRYLRLRLTLTGNGHATPRIRALRAYFPRFSYLDRYLPAVYREDADSASFLDRWLANLEGMATDLEGRIAAVNLLFNPRTTPGEALEWLAGWFELALDPAWDEAKRRLMLTNAMQFFSWRGTLRGLQMALALVVESQVDPSLFTSRPSRCVQRTRIVELYRAKVTPGVVLGDPTQDALPRAAAPGGWWAPGDGAQAVRDAYGAALAAAGLAAAADGRFPVIAPASEPELDVWTAFTRAALGFVPAVIDPQLWRDFLARRYPGPAGLLAYGVTDADGLLALLPPAELPDGEAALWDWYQMQTVVLRAWRAAHRFRVLLPVSAATRATIPAEVVPERLQLLSLARRVVEMEKPAHTVFDVRFYWDAFRVGEARLELDTLVDLGSRSPMLLTPAVLDQAHLGENVLVRREPGARVLPVDWGCR